MDKEAMERNEKEASIRVEMRTMVFCHGWSAFVRALRTILMEAPAQVKKAHGLDSSLGDGQPPREKEPPGQAN
jgi:hypothetical protein